MPMRDWKRVPATIYHHFHQRWTISICDALNLLVVDPFPPGVQDPQTLHKLIWDDLDAGVPFELPADEPLLLASYRAAVLLVEFTPQAFIEPFRVGADLPDMPAWPDTASFIVDFIRESCENASIWIKRPATRKPTSRLPLAGEF